MSPTRINIHRGMVATRAGIVLLAAAIFTRATASLRPLPVDSWSGKRVLIITAHPDDAEGFSGGMIRALQLQGDVDVNISCHHWECGGMRNATGFYDCEKRRSRSRDPQSGEFFRCFCGQPARRRRWHVNSATRPNP